MDFRRVFVVFLRMLDKIARNEPFNGFAISSIYLKTSVNIKLAVVYTLDYAGQHVKSANILVLFIKIIKMVRNLLVFRTIRKYSLVFSRVSLSSSLESCCCCWKRSEADGRTASVFDFKRFVGKLLLLVSEEEESSINNSLLFFIVL